MKRAALFLMLVACNSDEKPKPDPTGTGGASSSSAATTTDVSATSSVEASSSASGTGGSTPKQAEFTGGTRLKVRLRTAEDGATQQLGFYDSQLQTNCVFVRGEDNVERCLPLDHFAAAMPPSTAYVDAACTQLKTFYALGSCATIADGYLAWSAPSPACQAEPVFQIHHIDSAAPAQLYSSDGSCTPIQAPAGWFALSPVAASSFVAATESVEP